MIEIMLVFADYGGGADIDDTHHMDDNRYNRINTITDIDDVDDRTDRDNTSRNN